MQVLHPGGDVVDGGLDAVALQRVVGLRRASGQLVEQQLAEERLALDRLLLRLDVLVEPSELDVVAGQQRATFAELRLDHGDLLRHRLVAQGDLLQRPDHGVVAQEGQGARACGPQRLRCSSSGLMRSRALRRSTSSVAIVLARAPARRGTSPGASSPARAGGRRCAATAAPTLVTSSSDRELAPAGRLAERRGPAPPPARRASSISSADIVSGPRRRSSATMSIASGHDVGPDARSWCSSSCWASSSPRSCCV